MAERGCASVEKRWKKMLISIVFFFCGEVVAEKGYASVGKRWE
jgi:hypothetical protein